MCPIYVTFHNVLCIFKVSKGAKIRNQCNQVPHLTHDTNGKVTNSQLDTTNESQEVSTFPAGDHKVSKVAKIRNRYNQVPHLTQDTNGKVTNSQKTPQTRAKRSALKTHINRRAQRHSKHKTEKYKRSTKEVPPWNGQ